MLPFLQMAQMAMSGYNTLQGQNKQQPLPGQEAASIISGQRPEEFGYQGTPPSLQQQLGQNNQQIDQMVANTPQADFSQYTNGVLPPMGAIPDSQPMLPVQQSYQAGGGQQMPPAMPYSSLAGGINAPRTASERPTDQQLQGGPPVVPQNFNPFNMTGSAPSSPSSEQGFDPNMFLRLSEGYNRGGLVGALGQFLTNYK